MDTEKADRIQPGKTCRNSMEAMALGLPVVATPVAGVPEMIENGYGGFLIQPGDHEGLADRIVRLAQNAELRRSMGWDGPTLLRCAKNIFHACLLPGSSPCISTCLCATRPTESLHSEQRVAGKYIDKYIEWRRSIGNPRSPLGAVSLFKNKP